MRFIVREATIRAFAARDKTPPLTGEDASYLWNRRVNKKQRRDLRRLIIVEQNGLCAYTELNIEQSPFGYHLEHVKPKSKYPRLTFSPSNIVLNSMSSDDQQYYSKDEHFGGCYKGEDYDESLFLSCLEVDGNDYFIYPSSGYVEPRHTLSQDDKAKAEYTIRILNLNSQILVNRRRKFINELSLLIDECIENDVSLDRVRDEYIELDQNTNYFKDSFVSAARGLGL